MDAWRPSGVTGIGGGLLVQIAGIGEESSLGIVASGWIGISDFVREGGELERFAVEKGCGEIAGGGNLCGLYGGESGYVLANGGSLYACEEN